MQHPVIRIGPVVVNSGQNTIPNFVIGYKVVY